MDPLRCRPARVQHHERARSCATRAQPHRASPGWCGLDQPSAGLMDRDHNQPAELMHSASRADFHLTWIRGGARVVPAARLAKDLLVSLEGRPHRDEHLMPSAYELAARSPKNPGLRCLLAVLDPRAKLAN